MFVDIFSRISRKKNYKYEEPSSEGSKVTPLALGVKGRKIRKKENNSRNTNFNVNLEKKKLTIGPPQVCVWFVVEVLFRQRLLIYE